MSDYEDALANPTGVTELRHDFKTDGPLDGRIATLTDVVELQLRNIPPDLVLPEELLGLGVRHLGMAGLDDKLVVPELVARMPVERLDVWNLDAADLPPMPTLTALEIVVREPRREVAVLAERFGRLTHLEVWGSHLEHGELPDDIERFDQLETLYLVSCGVSDLPAALAKLTRLRTLGIRGCPVNAFPRVLFDMPRLEVLELKAELPGLPPEVGSMSGLRTLDLAFSFNKGAMVSSFDDTSKLKPLPRALGSLVDLERLNIACCGVTDIDVLRPLAKLRALDVSWAGIDTVEPLAGLTALEELTLDHCDRVEDLSPLAALTNLRKLSLDSTEPASLDVVRSLPALRELHIEGIETKLDAIYQLSDDVELHASEDILERYRDRAKLRGLPTLAELEPQLASRDVDDLETVLDQLVVVAEASSTPRRNALAALGIPIQRDEEEGGGDDDDDDLDDDGDDEDEDDDDDDDDEDDAEDDEDGVVHAGPHLPALDLALDRHLATLSPDVLARLFGALFRRTEDDFHATIRIANELVSRSDAPEVDAAQQMLVDAFAKANEHHDAGHREHGHGVHDTLIDRVFPLLRGPALAKLLAWASDDHLDDEHGDGLIALFVPALERADPVARAALIARLGRYLESALRYRPEVGDRVWSLLAPVAQDEVGIELAALQARLADKLAAARVIEDLGKQLRTDATAPKALSEAAALPDDQLEELQGALWSANRIVELPRPARRQLFQLWERRKRDDGIGGAIATAARTASIDELRDDVSVLSADRDRRGQLLREAVLVALRAEDYPAIGIDTLRELATELDGLSRTTAASRELRALLFGGAASWEQATFERGVGVLEVLERYEPAGPGEKRAGSDSDLASMVANLAECGEFDLLGNLARHLHKLSLGGKALERILAQLVAVAIVGGDPDAYDAIAPLLPATITWDILAYNLACKAARDGDRARTFEYTNRALELGKSPDQFLGDDDFEPFADDPEFVALLDGHR